MWKLCHCSTHTFVKRQTLFGETEPYPIKSLTCFCCMRDCVDCRSFQGCPFQTKAVSFCKRVDGHKPEGRGKTVFFHGNEHTLFISGSKQWNICCYLGLSFCKVTFPRFNSCSRQIYQQERNRPLTFASSLCTNHAFQLPSTETVHNKQVPEVELWWIHTFQNVLLLQLVAVFKGTILFEISCQFHQTCWVLYCHCRKWMTEFTRLSVCISRLERSAFVLKFNV